MVMAGNSLKAQESGASSAILRTVTLLAQARHHDGRVAAVNFAIGVRGDSKDPLTNYYDLRYGGRSENGDMDWFEVATGENSWSQIKDLGAASWSDIRDVPVLLPSIIPHNNGLTEVSRAGKVIQRSPEGVLVKAIPGHIYLLHSKHDKVDFYVLVRIEEMKASDECTISWKIVPSPESN
jgi:hypothetical protein